MSKKVDRKLAEDELITMFISERGEVKYEGEWYPISKEFLQKAKRIGELPIGHPSVQELFSKVVRHIQWLEE